MSTIQHNINAEFFRQLDRFSFIVRKKVSTIYAGSHRSVRIGYGINTVGYREYNPGDELRSVDWKVYGRSEKLYVRQFEEDKNLTAHILVDASKSMDYPQKKLKKYEYAVMLAMGFAYMITRDNDKFAISTFAEKVDINQPRRGKKYLFKMLDHLEKIDLNGQTRINESLLTYSNEVHSRSLIIIISDFMDSLESISSAIYRYSNHDLILLQVLDPSEAKLNMYGHTKFRDMENSTDFTTYVSDKFKDNYQEKLTQHINDIQNLCYHLGAEFYTFTTDMPIFDAFLTIDGRHIHGF